MVDKSKRIKAQKKLLAGIEDWRGCAMFITLIGGFICAGVAIATDRLEALGAIIPLMTFVIKWYFDAKENKK